MILFERHSHPHENDMKLGEIKESRWFLYFCILVHSQLLEWHGQAKGVISRSRRSVFLQNPIPPGGFEVLFLFVFSISSSCNQLELRICRVLGSPWWTCPAQAPLGTALGAEKEMEGETEMCLSLELLGDALEVLRCYYFCCNCSGACRRSHESSSVVPGRRRVGILA